MLSSLVLVEFNELNFQAMKKNDHNNYHIFYKKYKK